MKFDLVNELVVPAPAADVWAVYSSPSFPKLIPKIYPPGMVESVDIVEGDGHLGTVLQLVFSPGTVPLTYKEKFVTIDHDKRLKEALQIEGGYLEMGATFYMDSFQILEKDSDSCIIKSMTKCEVPDELFMKLAPLISVFKLVVLAKSVEKYVLEHKNPLPSEH